ncbi:hemerythrin domain-containing protein [Streptomyces sp. NPDC055749]
MGHGGNVIAELTADHREVEEIFARIDAQPVGHPERRHLTDRLTSELVRHAVAEETHLYPSVRRYVPDGDALADQEIADHGRIERMLKDLEGRNAEDPDFNDLVAKLKFEVASHVREEEAELFPKLTASCPSEELDMLGQLVRRT